MKEPQNKKVFTFTLEDARRTLDKPPTEVAKEFGVTYRTVYNYRKRLTHEQAQ